MTTLNLKIAGMHCDSCPKVIALDLEALGGVREVKIDRPSATAEVTFDEKAINSEAILETIKNAGYQGELTA